MPALDLALRLWVIRCATDMLDAPAVEPFGQIAGDIGGTIVGQQPRAVDDRDLIEPGGRQRQVERLSDISGPHRGAELRGGTAPRCSPHPAGPRARCGSSPRPRTAGASHAGGPSRPLPPAVSPARISASSSLLMATMNQKSSLPE